MVHSFTLDSGRQVACNFVIIRLDRSCLVWVGTASSPPMLRRLTMALGKPTPVATTLFGAAQSGQDEASALRLSRRTGLAVILGSDLDDDPEPDVLRRYCEKFIADKLSGP